MRRYKAFVSVIFIIINLEKKKKTLPIDMFILILLCLEYSDVVND